MTSLNSIDLEPGSNSSFPGINNFGIVWSMLRSVRIVGILNKSDLERIRGGCNSARHLHLEMFNGATSSALLSA
jgi:hypothetical protein